jgi:2-succinyl-5-enolpyruvyl-6-hydroxy-3-cyclohexene-1-carboxylate synthase
LDIAAANTAAARSLVAGLAARGVRHVCITPGSRSTPLTVAFAEQDVIRPWLHLDERSAAFFALGISKATGTPVTLVCTSGTASANYFPAVAEANLARVPLIVCTADRPSRLRNVGAPQTIDQVDLYGRHVRLSLDLPAPQIGDSATAVENAVRRAVEAATGPLPGPVHLNVPFEEPLIATPDRHPAAVAVTQGQSTPAIPRPPDFEAPQAIEGLLQKSSKPAIIAGPEVGGLPAASVTALAKRLRAPILADPLSGLRTGSHDRSQILDSYDALFGGPIADDNAPDLILRFGAVPTSKALGRFLERRSDIPQVLVDAPRAANRDPFASASVRLSGNSDAVAMALREFAPSSAKDPAWLRGWLAADEAARNIMCLQAKSFSEMFEGRVFVELQHSLPAGATVFAGNSMPVRDMDSFLFSDEKPLHLESNRGANGIDGIISTALGVAAVQNERVVLVIGDVSFCHDMNSLWAAKRHALDLTIVLINNGGGGIFNYLPQAQHESFFEEWFATPPGLNLRLATELFGGRHGIAEDWDTFRAALNGHSGLNVIEVRTDRIKNVAMHRQAWDEVAARAWPGG